MDHFIMIAETNAAVSESPDVFSEIHNKRCNIAIWKRVLSFNAAKLLTGNVQSFRFIVDIENCQNQLLYTMQEAGYPDSDITKQLALDIADLCSLFEPYAGMLKFEVRLEIVDNDACRKFHSDFVTVRLISTYTGPRTQWLDRDHGHIAGQVDPNAIQQLQAGDVGIFKGRRSTRTPAIHRSPPIEGTGQKRLILVLNPFEETD
jgi:hypothetical protein